MTEGFTTITMEPRKHIALVAHDNRKQDLIEWAMEHKEELARHALCGTGTTAALVARHTGLDVTPYRSGPLGGDMQLGSRITEGQVDFMIFFWDPLEAQPHDPDIKALLRIAVVYDIPVATNRATADFLMNSRFMNREYKHTLQDFQALTEKRAETMRKEFA